MAGPPAGSQSFNAVNAVAGLLGRLDADGDHPKQSSLPLKRSWSLMPNDRMKPSPFYEPDRPYVMERIDEHSPCWYENRSALPDRSLLRSRAKKARRAIEAG